MDEIPGEVPQCRACGGKVVIQQKPVKNLRLNERPRTEPKRVCVNPDCILKSEDAPMGLTV